MKSTTKETKAGERTVKGWAVVDVGWPYPGIYFAETEAKEAVKKIEKDYPRHDLKVVECTITYSLT